MLNSPFGERRAATLLVLRVGLLLIFYRPPVTNLFEVDGTVLDLAMGATGRVTRFGEDPFAKELLEVLDVIGMFDEGGSHIFHNQLESPLFRELLNDCGELLGVIGQPSSQGKSNMLAGYGLNENNLSNRSFLALHQRSSVLISGWLGFFISD